MIKKILTIEKDSETLRQVSEPVGKVDKEVEKLIVDLIDTLSNQKNPSGLGLSAPQIGILKRVFVARLAPINERKSKQARLARRESERAKTTFQKADNKKTIKAFINPEITKFSKETSDYLEGCLSVPQFYGHVIRPAKITIKSKDRSGQSFKKNFAGLLSRVIQHEIDHLNGALFIDHVHNQKGKLYKYIGLDKKGEEKFAEVIVE